VQDTGIGIKAEVLPRVFDLFVQSERALDRSQGGLGIGLTLVKSLVEMHGGRVEAHSHGPGEGSEFVVRLPVVSAVRRERSPAREEVGRVGRSPGLRVLVVDDNRDAATTLAMLLRLMGHAVQTTYDGPAAVETARVFQPQVVLLDIGLPAMNGYEVARILREEFGPDGIVLIAVTGYGQEDEKRLSLEAGCHHHLTKPVDPTTLLQLLAHQEPLPVPAD
jgi:CheY-like chemotaxis protein